MLCALVYSGRYYLRQWPLNVLSNGMTSTFPRVTSRPREKCSLKL